jgi:hypothetical protein
MKLLRLFLFGFLQETPADLSFQTEMCLAFARFFPSEAIILPAVQTASVSAAGSALLAHNPFLRFSKAYAVD